MPKKKDPSAPDRRETHGAYKALKLLKEGDFPDRRTRYGAALAAIEDAVRDHFHEFNALQEVEFFFTTLPLVGFLLKKPMTNDKEEISPDWRWSSHRLDKSLNRLVELADSQPKQEPDLKTIIAEYKTKDTGSKSI
jgi:hypothetical protein